MQKIIIILAIFFSVSLQAKEGDFFYGGYGEIKFSINKGESNTSDVHRLVTYLGYKFSDKILFNSEIEIEHTNEIAIEFAYIAYTLNQNLKFRVGHLLIPFGLLNHNHEPTLFPLVSRPEIERNIIPSTWHENGIELLGSIKKLRYHLLYIVGFDAKKFDSAYWIRKGRQKGGKDISEDMAVSLNLEYDWSLNLNTGASYYFGNSAQGAETEIGKVDVRLKEVHLSYKVYQLELKLLYTEGSLSQVEKLNEWRLSTGKATRVSKNAKGYYGYLSYNLAPLLNFSSIEENLLVFVYYSQYQYLEPKTKSIAITGVGVNYKPLPNVNFKIDYLMNQNKRTSAISRAINLGVGFVF